MLHSFYFKNFFSFRDRQEISLDVPATAPHDERFTNHGDSISGLRFSKALVVLGHNASGKSNLLKALFFMRRFVFESSLKSPLATIFPPQFALPNEGSDSEFGFVIEHNGICYEYHLEFNNERVLKESLKSKTKSTKKKFIFSRIYKKELNCYDVKTMQLTDLAKKFLYSVDKDVSLVSYVFFKCEKEDSGLDCFVESIIYIEANFDNFYRKYFFEIKEKDPSTADKVIRLADSFNLGLSDIVVKREKSEYIENQIKNVEALQHVNDYSIEFLKEKWEALQERTSLRAFGKHIINDKEYLLDINYESGGTKKLLDLLILVSQVLERGSILIYDEIESHLHPIVVEQILDLFFSPLTNPKNAQIICSTHNVLLLRRVDKSQVVLVEKDADFASQAYKIENQHRRDTSLMDKYLAGVYGGVMPGF